MVALLLKAFLFYCLYLLARAAFRGFKIYRFLSKSRQNHGGRRRAYPRGEEGRGEVIEAQYRVIKEED